MMAASEKLILKILWNYIMINFQVKHGQCDRSYYPQKFAFEDSKLLLDLCLAQQEFLLLICPEICP